MSNIFENILYPKVSNDFRRILDGQLLELVDGLFIARAFYSRVHISGTIDRRKFLIMKIRFYDHDQQNLSLKFFLEPIRLEMVGGRR